MANKFKLKQSAVAGKVPVTTDLELGELAINTNDGKLFLKKKVGTTETIVDVTASAGGVSGVTATAPVVSSGGTAPVISMAAATATVNGYMTSTYAAKLDGIAAGAQVNTVTSVAGKTGAVTLSSSDVGLGNVENKSSATIRSEITSSNVTGALGFTPVARAGANRPGGYRLQRRDDDSDYSVQTYWTGARWRLYGYVGDAAHADTHVGYADAAGWGGDCPGLGSNQSWQAVSRAQSTNYTNTTGRAIELVVSYTASNVGQRCVFVVGGVTIYPQNGQGGSSTYGGARITIPNGATYQWYTAGGTASSISTWELR